MSRSSDEDFMLEDFEDEELEIEKDKDSEEFKGFDDEDFGDLDDIEDDDDKIGELIEESSEQNEDDDSSEIDTNGAPVVDKEQFMSKDERNISISEDDVEINENGMPNVMLSDTENENNFTLEYLDYDKIRLTKRIRSGYNIGVLMKEIQSTGLLEPIVVAPLATKGYYVLIAGLRRYLACTKVGIRRIPCVINHKVKTADIPMVEALYNHKKSYSIEEMVAYIRYLESKKGIRSSSMIEHLLQLNNGDYAKLKDILNDNDPDITEKLYDGQYTIEMAFKKLEQRRKKEGKDEQELKNASKVYDNASSSGADMYENTGDLGDGVSLTDEQISAIGIKANDIGKSGDSIEEMMKEGNDIKGFEPHKQNPEYREALPSEKRLAIIDRDKCSCRICGMGGQEYRQVLDVHHITEVYLGGDDSDDNLITACTCCHKLVHLWGRGELHIRPLEEMDEKEKEKFKNIVELGNVIRKGMAARNMNREQLKKMDKAQTIGRTKPGTPQQAG